MKLAWETLARALNAIYNGVDKNVFRLINRCVSAQERWNVLKVAHESTSKVKLSRLQLLISKFEAKEMDEDETISYFISRLCDLAMNPSLSSTKCIKISWSEKS